MKQNKTLSLEKLAEIKKNVAESLALDRHGLIFDFPFTAAIAMRLDLIPVRDLRCSTACTDGKSIYFDCDFYSKLNKKERAFVLAHEIWHCVMLHLSRRQTRDPNLFNIATDMEVNQLLLDEAKGKDIEPPEGLYFPPDKLKGKSAEVIYEALLKDLKKQAKNQKQNQSGSGKSGSGDNNDDNNSTGKNSDKDKNKDSSTKNKNSNKSTGNKDKKLKGQFDKHIYSSDENDNDENAEPVTDQWGEVGFDDDFRPRISEDFADQMREHVTAAAQQIERQQGTLPAGVKSILEKTMKPEMNWREVLSQFVTQCYNGTRKWLPPNRRHVYNEMYFQSRRDEMLTGVICVDTSGSCLNELPKFFGELKGLISTFGGYRLYVLQADAKVDQVDIFDSNENPLDPEITNFEISGGGGTDYGPCFKWVDEEYTAKEGKQPDFLIYFGDMYANMSYKAKPQYPVLWLITKDGADPKTFCDFGRKIYFKESQYDY